MQGRVTSSPGPGRKRFLAPVGALVAAAAMLSASAAAAQSTAAHAAAALPKKCPSHSVVSSTLGLGLRARIISYTSATYQGAGAASTRAMPSGPSPAKTTQKTCLYTYTDAQKSATESIGVPVTITFEFPVTKAIFSAARKAAGQSIDPIVVRRVGDTAWAVKTPSGDPRGGNSLFVLSGKTEVVVGAPPKASIGQLAQLVRGIL
jgi:hypothetical protein